MAITIITAYSIVAVGTGRVSYQFPWLDRAGGATGKVKKKRLKPRI